MSTQTDICKYCGQRIRLIQTGLHYKWVTNPKKVSSWKCENDPEFPVRGHSPRDKTLDVSDRARVIQV